MDINLNKDEIIVVLDALVEAVAFDKNADEIKEVYNKIVKQALTINSFFSKTLQNSFRYHSYFNRL